MPNNNQPSNNPWGGNKSPPDLNEFIEKIRNVKKLLPGGNPFNFGIILIVLLIA